MRHRHPRRVELEGDRALVRERLPGLDPLGGDASEVDERGRLLAVVGGVGGAALLFYFLNMFVEGLPNRLSGGVIPYAFLLSVSLVYGRMAADRELIALRRRGPLAPPSP